MFVIHVVSAGLVWREFRPLPARSTIGMGFAGGQQPTGFAKITKPLQSREPFMLLRCQEPRSHELHSVWFIHNEKMICCLECHKHFAASGNHSAREKLLQHCSSTGHSLFPPAVCPVCSKSFYERNGHHTARMKLSQHCGDTGHFSR